MRYLIALLLLASTAAYADNLDQYEAKCRRDTGNAPDIFPGWYRQCAEVEEYMAAQPLAKDHKGDCMTEVRLANVPDRQHWAASRNCLERWVKAGGPSQQERAGQERQRQQMAQRGANQRLQVFVDNHGAKGWIKYDVLLANPFAAEGKAYLFNSRFIRMLTPSSAIFGNSEHGFVVSNIPNQLFMTPKAAVFVGRVLGTTNTKNQFGAEVAAPHVRFLQLICTEPNCADTLSANATFR